jgi:hypothetical protein
MTTQPTQPGADACEPDDALAGDPLLAPARDALQAAHDTDGVPLDERARRLAAAQAELARLLEDEPPGGPRP